MSTEPKYIDLLITDRNFTLDSGNEPELCGNRVSIAQDVVHMIIESGIVKELITERSPVLRADIMMQMELLVESDDRIVPGNLVSRCSKDRIGDVGQNDSLKVGGTLTEQIQGIRRSVAAAQELLAPIIRLGSEEMNVLSLLTDTLDVLSQLAEQTAQHTHSNTGTPTNSEAITATGEKTNDLREKYAPFIA
ncbi:DUF2590 family protein [Serratia marcescens]|nr:hypothetical protein SMQC13_15010 [Serratia marcescens]